MLSGAWLVVKLYAFSTRGANVGFNMAHSCLRMLVTCESERMYRMELGKRNPALASGSITLGFCIFAHRKRGSCWANPLWRIPELCPSVASLARSETVCKDMRNSFHSNNYWSVP